MTSPQYFSAVELAGLPGMPGTKRSVNRLADRLNWPRMPSGRSGGGWLYPMHCLPVATQAALLVRAGTPIAAANDDQRRVGLWAMYDRKPAAIKAKAEQRLRALDAVEQLVAGGLRKLAAIDLVASQTGEHSATIRRWFALVADLDRADWLPALAPKWSGRTPDAECDPRAWEQFKGDFLRMSQPRAEPCYRRLEEAAAVHGWTIPSLRTLQRRLARELPPATVRLARGGPDALKRMFPAQRRDHTVFTALEAVNADGHTFDVFCRDKSGRVFRPVVVPFQDIYSGKWLSWRVGESECAELVRLSFADLARAYGLPRMAFFDNGRAFASKWNTGGIANRYRFKVKDEDPQGVFKLLGVEVHFTKVYSGQSKPIERSFQDVIEEISKHPACEGAYTGGRPDAKPENYGSRAVPFEDFVRLVDDRVRAMNARDGRTSSACAGRSFDATFAESYARVPVRRATDEQLRLMLLAAEGVTPRADTGEIHLFGNRYWSAAPALARAAGRKVIVRFDPQDLTLPLHVYGTDGRYICAADLQELAGFADEAAARKHNRARQNWHKAQRAQLDAERAMSAAQVAAQIPAAPEPTKPESKVVRPYQFKTAAQASPAPFTQEQRDAMFATGLRIAGIVKEG